MNNNKHKKNSKIKKEANHTMTEKKLMSGLRVGVSRLDVGNHH